MESSFLQFNVLELLSLIGLIHTVYVIVHLVGRAKKPKQIFIPLLFFTFLGAAFFFNMAERQWAEGLGQDGLAIIATLKWLSWAIIPAMGAIFTVQILRISRAPSLYLWVLLPLYGIVLFFSGATFDTPLDVSRALNIGALILGAISLLTIWFFKQDLTNISSKKSGKERFWVVISLIIMSIALLSLYFITFSPDFDVFGFEMARSMIGLGFVYLGSASLFRIYPYAVDLKAVKKSEELTRDEEKIASRIEKLLNVEKIYQEPGYNRTSLAQELDVSETQLSKIVGIHFDRTVPQLLNKYRVRDSKSLLSDTSAEIATITYESGFNSVATFNRVFKEEEGISPTAYRKKTRTNPSK